MRRTLLSAAVVAVLVAAPVATAHALAPTPGVVEWADTVFSTGSTADDAWLAVAVDPGAKAPVLGGYTTSASGTNENAKAWSYRPDGIWRFEAGPFDGGANGFDRFTDVAVSPAGVSTFAGEVTTATAGLDIVTVRLAPDGSPLWPAPVTFGGPAGRDDEAAGVALDAAGNTYVAGTSQDAAGATDIVLVKYDPAGTKLWSRRFNGAWRRDDRATCVAVRGSAVYVAGLSRHPGHGDDLVLIKYSSAGVRRWVRYYDDAQHRSDAAYAVCTAPGAVYVAGVCRVGVISGSDTLLIKYSTAGARQWLRSYRGEGLGAGWVDMAVDSVGRIHVTGFVYRSATGDDLLTALYGPAGTRRWVRQFSSAGVNLDAAAALAVDAAGRTYVAGTIHDPLGDSDVVCIAYDPAAGATLWLAPYDGGSHSDEYANDIALSNDAAYVCGSGGVAGNGLDALTVKFSR